MKKSKANPLRKTARDGAARKRSVWKRAEEDLDAGAAFGTAMREMREQKQLTLLDVSKLTGITSSTLSRIENSKMAPTFAVLLKLMSFFEMEWPDLAAQARRHAKRPSIAPFFSKAEQNVPSSVTMKTGTYTFPHGDRPGSPFIPVILEVTASKPEYIGGLVGHPGIEFCYVLKGTLELHVENRETILAPEGSSIFFDSNQAHAYVAYGGKPVKLLIVSNARIFSSIVSSVRESAVGRAGQKSIRSAPAPRKLRSRASVTPSR